MIKFVIFLSFLVATLLFNPVSQAKTIKIAVIDTGIELVKRKNVKLCLHGHRDYTQTTLNDSVGHGTNVSGLIAQGNQHIDYCLIIIKFYNNTNKNASYALLLSLLQVSLIDVDIVHLSLGGKGGYNAEKNLIKRILDQGKIIVAAAGNNGENLNKNCNYYPACYDDRIHVVGNTGKTANYGNKYIDATINGNNKTALGITQSGSSQSAAIYTGKLIRKLKNVKKK